MAGSILNLFGALFIVLGAFALLGGLGTAGYGALDEQDHENQFLADP